MRVITPCHWRRSLATIQSTMSVHLALDQARHVLNHVARELRLEPALVQQVEDAAETQRVVEEGDASPLEVVENVVHRRQPVTELAAHVLAIERELALDVVDRQQVVLQQGELGLGRREVPVGKTPPDPDRIEQLQPQPLAFIERRR